MVPELIANLRVPPFLGVAANIEDDILVAAVMVAPKATAPCMKSRLPIFPEENKPFSKIYNKNKKELLFLEPLSKDTPIDELVEKLAKKLEQLGFNIVYDERRETDEV